MKIQQQTTIQVRGRGETKQKAFAAALGSVQRTVMGENSQNILLRIEPRDVRVVKAVKNVRREKFFFFFFPRDRVVFDVTLDIDVDVTILDIQEIEFDLQNKK